jgi:hypothetical protein
MLYSGDLYNFCTLQFGECYINICNNQLCGMWSGVVLVTTE